MDTITREMQDVVSKETETIENNAKFPPTPPDDQEALLYTINDVLLDRVRSVPDHPLVGYPKSSHGLSDYAFYTATDLDRFASGAVKDLEASGLERFQNPTENRVVAVLGTSNIDYVVSLFALSRMGYAVLLLSTRLSDEAYINLLAMTHCTNVLHSAVTEKQATRIQDAVNTKNFLIPEYSIYSQCVTTSPLELTGTREMSRKWAFIIHSSGSTGLPKPIFQTHGACIANYATSKGYRALLALPLYHNHGLSTFFRSLFKAKPVAIFNASVPLTGNNILQTMEATQPESFHGVPYVLKLLSEVDGGATALAKCQQVLYGGSSCPDELGDLLVNNGVKLISHYGATELGQLMTSDRPPEDKAWNYVRPLKNAQPYLKMVELEDGSYECVVLDGLPAKVSSNSNDPPNSFHTRDTFLKHPSLPNAWKYLGRIDDRVTLENGEKVLPVPIEHRIRQSKYVKDNLVFGIGKPLPGLMVVPSDECRGLSKAEILEIVWPDIMAANQNAEAFSQISRDMVVILDLDCTYPATDKGTMIRNRCYVEFNDLIETTYKEFESGSPSEEKLVLDIAGIEQFLLDLFRTQLGFCGIELDADFFEAGVDSLQAIEARSIIKKKLNIGRSTLGNNVVYDFANIKSLAAHLHGLREGDGSEQENELEVMSHLIQKYSSFTPRSKENEVIIVTGATGSLGAYVLSRLMLNDSVKKIYCLVRATCASSALDRVLSSLAARELPMQNVSKIVALPAQLGSEDLELSPSTLAELRTSLTKVIHVAWAVNFTLGVRNFEKQHIKGLHNLINLCLSSQRSSPAEFYFCSSISTAAGTPLPATIAEAPIPELAHAQGMGYARSKLVAERIVQAAAEQTGMVAKVLRVGQIVGDTVNGRWNATEAIPLLLQTAATLKALPALDETPSWLPVDVVADAILELTGVNPDVGSKAFSHDPNVVFHLQNTRTFRWTEDLLPALRRSGLEFEVLPKRQWVERLRQGEQDPKKNPAIKLLDFFTNKYDNDNPGRAGLVFDMEKSQAASPSLRDGVEIIESGLVEKFVHEWQRSSWWLSEED